MSIFKYWFTYVDAKFGQILSIGTVLVKDIYICKLYLQGKDTLLYFQYPSYQYYIIHLRLSTRVEEFYEKCTDFSNAPRMVGNPMANLTFDGE